MMKIYKNDGRYIDLAAKQGGGASSPSEPVVIDIENFVFNETPLGVINGSNATFTTAHNFIPESVEVYIGIKLHIVDDYITIGNSTIQLISSPLIGEIIQVNYIKI